MNAIDRAILTFINQLSRQSPAFDTLIVSISNNPLLKGGVLITIVWWLWYRTEERPSPRREKILATLFGCLISISCSRILALTLPFRVRPLHEESYHFLLPHGMSQPVLHGWSSFPSDHAALFFALSAGVFVLSRRAGILAFSHTIICISFPRMYLGVHYPTDIIGGAAIGMTIALLSNSYLARTNVIESIVRWSSSRPAVFYPFFFLLTYQIADMFDGSRAIINMGIKVFVHIFS